MLPRKISFLPCFTLTTHLNYRLLQPLQGNTFLKYSMMPFFSQTVGVQQFNLISSKGSHLLHLSSDHFLLSIFLSTLCMITAIWVLCPEHFTMLPREAGVLHSNSWACGEVVHLTFSIFTQQAIFLQLVMTWWIPIICFCAVLICCTQTLYIRRIARIYWIQTLKVISKYFFWE